MSICQYYRSRYNLEHFLRFGKTKLLLDRYQTPDLIHEEHWWKLCLFVYAQLYMAKSLVPKLPNSWEKYLPEYRDTQKNQIRISTAAQAQRGFAKLLDDAGTPALPCVQRGCVSGRKLGQSIGRRIEQPIIFKSKKASDIEQKIIIPGLENTANSSNLKEIQELISVTLTTLKKLNITPPIFTEWLCNST